MRKALLVTVWFWASGVLFWYQPARVQAQSGCEQFQARVRRTYNFNEAKLSVQQKLAKEKVLNRFWSDVRARKAQWLPCLRQAVADPKSNSFFRYDGSNLLVLLDPSAASKKLQIEIYTPIDFDVVGHQRWLETLAWRGSEGFDISAAATRWLSDSKAGYTIPEHGDFGVGSAAGSIFLFGSMNEAQATPVLLKLLQRKDHPYRDELAFLLASQATPEALKALRSLDTKGLHEAVATRVEAVRSGQARLKPRDKPKMTRDEWVSAFRRFLGGDGAPFSALVARVPDGERDVAMVLRPEDVTLVRRMRRRLIASGNPHMMDYYNTFTDILLTLVWKPEYAPES
jgi:hypothetical protein